LWYTKDKYEEKYNELDKSVSAWNCDYTKA
jgi:hypothetical protein